MQQPRNEGDGGAGNEFRSDAQHLTSKAADRLQSEVDSRKGTAATQAKSVANAMQAAAGELNDGGTAWLKSAIQQGAEQVQRFADSIEHKDSRELLHDVEDFARRSPGTFLAACAAAGFAAARLFRAGSSAHGSFHHEGQWDPSVEVEPPAGSATPSPSNERTNSPGEYV